WSADRPNNPWRNYEIRPLKLGLAGHAEAALVHDDRLFVMCLDGVPATTRQLTVTAHRFPEGGPAVNKVIITLGEGTRSWLAPTVLDDQLFIGTTTGIVRLDGRGRLTLLTEADGLPGTGVNAMAAHQ